MTTIYSVSPMEEAPNGQAFFATIAAAFSAAHEVADSGCEATVEANVITDALGKRALYCALANQVGFVRESRVVKVFPAKVSQYQENT